MKQEVLNLTVFINQADYGHCTAYIYPASGSTSSYPVAETKAEGKTDVEAVNAALSAMMQAAIKKEVRHGT